MIDVVIVVIAVDLTVVFIGRLLIDLIVRAAAGLRGARVRLTAVPPPSWMVAVPSVVSVPRSATLVWPT